MAKQVVDSSTILNEVKKFIGDPYVYGATGPNKFDCSGLTQYVYKALGISIPRTSEAQYTWSGAVSIPKPGVGDLVFYAGSDGTASSPGHVAIYAGDNKIIQAPHTGEDVKLSPIDDPGQPVGYRHIKGATTTTDSGSILSTIENGVEGAVGAAAGLISWPTDIVKFFSTGTEALTDFTHGLSLFFQPTTYVRIGAGVAGLALIIIALIFLSKGVGNGHSS